MMTPKEFELRIVDWFRSKLPRHFQVFHRKKYTGRTGQQYEIDVSFEGEIGGLAYVTLGECKLHRPSNPVEISVISAFAWVINDVGAHKGFFATSSYFQRGAYTVASSLNLALLEVRAAGVKAVLRLDPDDRPEPVMTLSDFNNLSSFAALTIQKHNGDASSIRLDEYAEGQLIKTLFGAPYGP